MLYEQLPRHPDLREAGWHSRGYLPHFDGREIPQFITCRLYDSVPDRVLSRWTRELAAEDSVIARITMQKRIERYLDQGYGEAQLKHARIAQLVEDVLLSFDTISYRLLAWVIMPNHIHFVAIRLEGATISRIMQSFKSLTSHRVNKTLNRRGRFWMPDYFDRYIRNVEHFANTVRYVENNPVKARLCERAEDWPYSSARWRMNAGEGARAPGI